MTVVTTSDRKVRVVQGFVDVAKAEVALKISKVMDFEDGIIANWEFSRSILSWLAAVPVPIAPDGDWDGLLGREG